MEMGWEKVRIGRHRLQEFCNRLRGIPLFAEYHPDVVVGKSVARVQFGPDIRRGVTELDGTGEAVGGVVVMRYGAQTRPTLEGVHQKVDEIRALHLLPPGVPAARAHEELTPLIAPADRYAMHVLLIEHGRKVCASDSECGGTMFGVLSSPERLSGSPN
jgi:hypothetical protein